MTGSFDRAQPEPAVHDSHDTLPGASDAWAYLGQKMRRLLSFVGNVLAPDEGLPPSDHDLAWTSLSRIERNSNPPSEVEKLSLSSLEHQRPVPHEDSTDGCR
jgi:hypothetical protein